MANSSMLRAQKTRYDEFYTQYEDIQREMNAYLEYNENAFKDKVVLCPCDDPEWSNFTKYFAQNFESLGLKKLISTSYALEAKKTKYEQYHQMTLFELDSPQFDEEKSKIKGKIFTLTRSKNRSKKLDYDDLQWSYLEGDGDFQSEEVTKLLEEADIVVTNPPFSLFEEFFRWITDRSKSFIILGNDNNLSYTAVFAKFMCNQVWKGCNHAKEFQKPDGSTQTFGNVSWFTNIEHGRRHQPLKLMTMKDNLRYNTALKNKLMEKYGLTNYPMLDNYDALEVPTVKGIPSDYDEMMAVPVNFIDSHNPDQFEIFGITDRNNKFGLTTKIYTKADSKNYSDLNRRGAVLNDKGQLVATFVRLLVKKKGVSNED